MIPEFDKIIMNLNNKPLNHNWNQFHVVLLKLGYKQKIEYENKYLYYSNGSIRITIPKLNKMDFFLVMEKLYQIGIDYDTFTQLYKEAYDSNKPAA